MSRASISAADSVGLAVRKFSEQITSVFTTSNSAGAQHQQSTAAAGDSLQGKTSMSSSMSATNAGPAPASSALVNQNPHLFHYSQQTIQSAASTSKPDLNGRSATGNNKNPSQVAANGGTAFTVSVSSLFTPCLDVFAIWLDGLAVDKAVDLLLNKQAACTGMFQSTGAASDSGNVAEMERRTRCHQFVLAQYRSFGMMEHYLHKPRAFGDQFLFVLPAHVKRKLVEMFYGFDENVVRELLGKKLNYRSRKDLDDVCSKTGVSLGSCRRQFDNIKRISKKVEEAQGPLVLNVERKFLFPAKLAAKYAHIIFLTSNRIEIGKKKLSQFTFEDFEYCSSVFMRYWTVKAPTLIEEFDAKLVQDLRDLKSLLFGAGAAPSLSFNAASNPGKEIYEQLKSLTFEYMAMKASEAGSTSMLTQSLNSGPSFSFALFGQQLNISGSAGSGQAATTTSNTTPSNISAINTLNKPPLMPNIPSSPISPTQQQQFQLPTLTKDFASTFKTILRNVLAICTGLTHPKEVRSIFIHLLEKIVEPCVAAGWREQDIDSFFVGLKLAWIRLSDQSRQQNGDTENVSNGFVAATSGSLSRPQTQTRISTADSNNRPVSSDVPVTPNPRKSLSMSLAGRLSLLGTESIMRTTFTLGDDEDVFERYGDAWERMLCGVHLSVLKLSNDLSVALA